jgi:hypothetical protein
MAVMRSCLQLLVTCSACTYCLHVLLAHPAEDELPIRSSRYNSSRGPVLINQHRSTRERCAAAAAFAADFGISMPVLVDPMPGEEQGEQQQQGAVTGHEDGLTAAPPAAAAAGDNSVDPMPGEEQGEQQQQDKQGAATGPEEAPTAAAAAAGVKSLDAGLVTGAEVPPVLLQEQLQVSSNSAAAVDTNGRSAARDAAAATMAAAAAAAASCHSCVGADTSCSISSSGSGSSRRHVIGYGASGPFDAALAPWPLRFYVLDRAGVLLYKADPQDCQYHHHHVTARTADMICLSCGSGWRSSSSSPSSSRVQHSRRHIFALLYVYCSCALLCLLVTCVVSYFTTIHYH